MGYEIASDTRWRIRPPGISDENDEIECSGWRYLVSRDGEIYYACFNIEREKVKVLRLDENKNLMSEGECNTEELQELQSHFEFPLVCYDRVRKALILELETHELIALHLSSARIEFVGKCESDCLTNLPYSNTLAPFRGSKQDDDGLNQLLYAVEFDDDVVTDIDEYDDSVHDVEIDEYELDGVEYTDEYDDSVHDVETNEYELDGVEYIDDDDE